LYIKSRLVMFSEEAPAQLSYPTRFASKCQVKSMEDEHLVQQLILTILCRTYYMVP